MLCGQVPSCGEGASSLFWLLVTMAAWLWSHSERSRMRCPPEFVPEYPSTLNCACTRERTALQSRHAPT